MKRIKLYGRLSTRKSDSLASYYELLGGLAFVAIVLVILFTVLFGESGIAIAFTIIGLCICAISILISYKIILRIIQLLKWVSPGNSCK